MKAVMEIDRTIRSDVLVIGGGATGVLAAIEADDKGAAVALLSKDPVTCSGLTPQTGASCQAGFNPKDSADAHFKDERSDN